MSDHESTPLITSGEREEVIVDRHVQGGLMLSIGSRW